MEARAYLKYLRISPRKVVILCDLIRGKDVKTATAYLMQTPKAASEPMLKLLKSAVANAAASRILTGRPVSTASAVRNSAQRARCRWDAVCLQSCWKRAELPEGALPEIPGIASGGSAYPNRKGGRTDASRVFMGSFYRYRRAGGVSAV